MNKFFKFCQWTHVVFGTGYLNRYVLIEIKYLFSVYINVWNVIEHDRFHTHAFPSISLFVKGQYFEEQLDNGVSLFKAPMIRFIPRTSNHRMLQSSKNAISITVAGPWDKMWTETFLDGTKRVLSWGRKEILSNHKDER
jgi:hypothetical protein